MTVRFAAAASQDADVFRALLEIAFCLALPEDVINRPGLRNQLERAPDEVPPPNPGPSRDQVLSLLDS
jgi:hypothetical protein